MLQDFWDIWKYWKNFRLDTVVDDSKEILKRIGIERRLLIDRSSDKTAEKYYSELNTSTLDRLYNFYELDFILFDFSPDEYYDFVNKD